MNFESLWMRQKRDLLKVIAIGKEEEKKSYNSETYHLVTEGNKAADQLIKMIQIEVDEYFIDEPDEETVINFGSDDADCGLPFEIPENNKMEDDLK